MAASNAMSTQQRIPAWKRIGLKLKYADDSAQAQYSSAAGTKAPPIDPAGTSTNGHFTHERPLKKRKTSREISDMSFHSNGKSTKAKSNGVDTLAPSTVEPRRKSVTFSVDTRDADDGPTVPLERSKPKQKSSKTGSVEENGSSVQIRDHVLEYLRTFHTDRAHWKFNKKKQTALLQNLFDLHRIPPQHTPAILQYLGGLQGAAAQQRLIGTASTILRTIAGKDDRNFNPDTMESEEARRAAYREALRRHIEQYERSGSDRSEYDEQQLAEQQLEIEQGKRAEAVLAELLQKELHPEDRPTQKESYALAPETVDQGKSTEHSIEKSKKRNRKTRTNVSDGESEIKTKPKKIIFDDDLLDEVFPKQKTYHDVAPKRKAAKGTAGKARGFAYTHGTRVDESGSESDSA